MKHPLTSKERRGLVAVAAAALLCISSGFIVRSCRHSASSSAPAAAVEVPADTVKDADGDNDSKEKKKAGGRKKKKKKSKTPKVYPTRDPLSQPVGDGAIKH